MIEKANNDLWANSLAVNQSGIGGIAGTLIPVDAIDQLSLQTQSSAETGRQATLPGCVLSHGHRLPRCSTLMNKSWVCRTPSNPALAD